MKHSQILEIICISGTYENDKFCFPPKLKDRFFDGGKQLLSRHINGNTSINSRAEKKDDNYGQLFSEIQEFARRKFWFCFGSGQRQVNL